MCCFVAVSCSLFSCSSDVYNEKENSQSKLITDLERINQELLSTLPSETKGWNNWNQEEKMKVVCADLVGAWAGANKGLSFGVKVGIGIGAPHLVGGGFCALGALVGGAWSSWMAAPTRSVEYDNFEEIQNTCKVIVAEDFSINRNAVIIKNENANNKINVSPDLLAETKLDERSLSIAEMHNIVLSTLDGSVTLDKTMIDISEENLKNDILNNKEFMDTCRAVGVRVQSGDFGTDDDLSAKIIFLFNRIVEDYASKTDDVAFIIGKYMEVIQGTTELTNDQKEIIKCGLATGLYSANYWENRYNEIVK